MAAPTCRPLHEIIIAAREQAYASIRARLQAVRASDHLRSDSSDEEEEEDDNPDLAWLMNPPHRAMFEAYQRAFRVALHQLLPGEDAAFTRDIIVSVVPLVDERMWALASLHSDDIQRAVQKACTGLVESDPEMHLDDERGQAEERMAIRGIILVLSAEAIFNIRDELSQSYEEELASREADRDEDEEEEDEVLPPTFMSVGTLNVVSIELALQTIRDLDREEERRAIVTQDRVERARFEIPFIARGVNVAGMLQLRANLHGRHFPSVLQNLVGTFLSRDIGHAAPGHPVLSATLVMARVPPRAGDMRKAETDAASSSSSKRHRS